MPLVYFGRKTKQFGRPLWEILLNLKNFGKGRIVTRYQYKRYPEVTYYKIVDVQPTVIEYPDNMRGSVWVEKTWRGKTIPELHELGRVAFKPDFWLIPKHEEEAFINSGEKPKEPEVIHPRYMDLPPLWQELIKREKLAEGKVATPEDLRIQVLYHWKNPPSNIAEEGQEPTYKIPQFRPASPSLYKGIKWTREENSISSNS